MVQLDNTTRDYSDMLNQITGLKGYIHTALHDIAGYSMVVGEMGQIQSEYTYLINASAFKNIQTLEKQMELYRSNTDDLSKDIKRQNEIFSNLKKQVLDTEEKARLKAEADLKQESEKSLNLQTQFKIKTGLKCKEFLMNYQY